MIRLCTEKDVDEMMDIINSSAQAFRSVIPGDCWQVPYMPRPELQAEMEAGVEFWGYEEEGILLAVMGIQDRGDSTLIRHAYTCPERRRQGIGSMLLSVLIEKAPRRPILVGTWAAAEWAIDFYEVNGFALVSHAEKEELLRKYWTIPERQIEESVVLKLE